jgi:hypothetical protein
MKFQNISKESKAVLSISFKHLLDIGVTKKVGMYESKN